jgi:hypothetical protein
MDPEQDPGQGTADEEAGDGPAAVLADYAAEKITAAETLELLARDEPDTPVLRETLESIETDPDDPRSGYWPGIEAAYASGQLSEEQYAQLRAAESD